MTLAPAMSFFHADDLHAAYNMAQLYAGPLGHVATIPDIIEGRIHTPGNSIFWGRYFTTRSAEYYGLYQGEKPMIVVAHGVGPMADIEGIEKAYSLKLNDRDRREGGHISQEEFDALVDGKYGFVETVDVAELFAYYNVITKAADKNGGRSLPGLWYNGYFSVPGLACDPLFVARMGGESYAQEYLESHARVARKEIAEKYQHRDNFDAQNITLYVGKMEEPSGQPYREYGLEHFEWFTKKPQISKIKGTGLAYANLLTISQPMWTGMEPQVDHLTFDIGIHEWSHAQRFLGIRESYYYSKAVEFDYDDVIVNNPQAAFDTNTDQTVPSLVSIIRDDEKVFTEVAKDGNRMDTGRVEYPVTKIEKVGEPVTFDVEGGNMFFLKYDLSEVAAIQPEAANAYEKLSHTPDGARITVQFYAIEADRSKRLLSEEELMAVPQKLYRVIEELSA